LSAGKAWRTLKGDNIWCTVPRNALEN
jgi:hypothetical protein